MDAVLLELELSREWSPYKAKQEPLPSVACNDTGRRPPQSSQMWPLIVDLQGNWSSFFRSSLFLWGFYLGSFLQFPKQNNCQYSTEGKDPVHVNFMTDDYITVTEPTMLKIMPYAFKML
ncbi:hypothetical protein STEG23_030155 [Scotinomys teguina]